MSLPADSPERRLSNTPFMDERASKRRKTDASQRQADSENESTLIRRHPLGVRPAGNALTSNKNAKACAGDFARFPDELLMHFLEVLQVPHLLRLGSTCRALHAFTRSEELWRNLFVKSPPSYFTWRATWRSTYLSQPQSQEPRVDCSSVFSDVLHRPFYCAHVPLEWYARNIPHKNEITRLKDLSSDEFALHWVDKPFILTAPVKQWPVFRSWSFQNLLDTYSDVAFRAESVDWPFKTYFEYLHNSHDESPLYLFDRAFVEKMDLTVSLEPDLKADYWQPGFVGWDVLSVLGEQRPDHRWLIVGPERSGSTFHKDPNATSAWNAVVRGTKYWIMFPSSPSLPPPPGVYVSADQSEVTSPLSIAEWLLGFHAEARSTPGCVEGICGDGEVLHVPSGWYHLVLNLEPSVAITQNFIPRQRVGAVLQFLRDQKQSVSGFREDIDDPYQLFVDRLGAADSELLEEGLEDVQRQSCWMTSKGKWDSLKEPDDEGGFSFGFADDDDDEVV